MRRTRVVRTHHGNHGNTLAVRTSVRSKTRSGDDPRAELIAAPARAVFARMMDHHHYQDLLEYAQPRFVLIECLAKTMGVKHRFRCFVGSTQAAAMRALDAPLTCSFSLGKAGWRGTLRRGEQALGAIVRRGGEHCFEVNGERLMALRIGAQSPSQPSDYRLEFGETLFEHTLPQWSKRIGQHTLKYDLLKTKRAGIASCKNFRMDHQGKSVLEFLRLNSSQMLVAVAPPFNAFIAAVVGIARFRE